MQNYVLSCSSPVDLTKEHLDKRNISVLIFSFRLGDESYYDDFGKSLSYTELYRRMKAGEDSKTSQTSIGDYLDYFSGLLDKGTDVLHVCMSSGLTGDYNSANSAALIARERYPDRKLIVVDSLAASSGYGMLMDHAADLRDGGMDIDSLAEWICDNRLKLHHWFYSGDLTFYIKGGRISKAAGLFGGLLGICPVMEMDGLGRLAPRAKVRSKKRAVAELTERMRDNADGGKQYSGKVYVCHSECYQDAELIAETVKKEFPDIDGDVQIYDIGAAIGCHSGPGTAAVFFWGRERKE